jgi:hypothetical protein
MMRKQKENLASSADPAIELKIIQDEINVKLAKGT